MKAAWKIRMTLKIKTTSKLNTIIEMKITLQRRQPQNENKIKNKIEDNLKNTMT